MEESVRKREKIIDTEASDKEKDDTDNHKGDSFYMFFCIELPPCHQT